jgi:hypothetical protein
LINILSEQAGAQFLAALSLRMILVGKVFNVTMAVVDIMQLMEGLKAFTTGGDIDLPLCENINDTIRDKSSKPLSSWKNSYATQH